MMLIVFNTYGLCSVTVFQAPVRMECDPGADARKRTVSKPCCYYNIEVNPFGRRAGKMLNAEGNVN